MKGLVLYLLFLWEEFCKGKVFEVVGCGPWLDFETKEKKGTKVDVIIIKDDTPYPVKDGKIISNRYERLQFKVPDKELSIPVGSIVEPVGAEAKVWGDYHNKLSVKAKDVHVVNQGGK